MCCSLCSFQDVEIRKRKIHTSGLEQRPIESDATNIYTVQIAMNMLT